MKMTDGAVMAAMRSDSALNRARQAFSGRAAGIEQAGQQRRPPGPVEIRRMEFEAVAAIAGEFGVEVHLDAPAPAAVRIVVHAVEIMRPPEHAGSEPSVVLVSIQPGRAEALRLVADGPEAGERDCWCWRVSGLVVGDPDGVRMDSVFLTPDGRTFASADEAWDAPAPSAAPSP